MCVCVRMCICMYVCVHIRRFYNGLLLLVTLAYQTLLFCMVPINSILGFIIRTYKKAGFGRLR